MKLVRAASHFVHVIGEPRRRRLARAAAAATALSLAVSLLPASSAQAEPTPAQAEKAVEQLTEKMELATEKYNDARANLAASQQRVAEFEPKAKDLSTQLAARQKELSKIAASAYAGDNSGMMTSLLVTGSPRDFLDRAAYLNAISARQHASLAGFLASKKQFDDAKAKVDQELVAQAKNEKTLRDQRTAINADLAKWQALSTRITASSADNDVVVSNYTGPATGKAAIAIKFAYAQAQAHRMYQWGAAGPTTYDCSGLTMAAWAKAGVHMPHTARGQYAMFPKVSLSNLRPGDLVMYGSPIHHVAMYVGNGNIIHASTFGKPVMVRPMQYGGSKIAGAVRPG